MSEVKENIEAVKRDTTSLPVPFKRTTKNILIGLQGQFITKHKRKITLADMAGIVIEKTIKHFKL